MPKSLVGILTAALVVLATVYVYNRFIAKEGKTIANLGEKQT